MYSSRISRFGTLAAVAGLFGALASVHCSSTAATSGCKQLSATVKAGVSVPCLCADGSQQSKLCQEDNTFAECAPCAAKVACPQGLQPGESSSCECPDGTSASQPCNEDGNLGECGPCDLTVDAGKKKDGGICNNDGTPDPGEACDDGNGVETDDCTSNCTVTENPKTNACPGQAVAVWDATGTTVKGSTDGYTSKHTATAACPNGGLSTAGGSPDRVYAVTVMKDSVALDVTVLAANFEHSLWVNTDCDKPASQIACADVGHQGIAKEALSVPNVKANTTYYVWIDGEQNSAGTYTLRFRVR